MQCWGSGHMPIAVTADCTLDRGLHIDAQAHGVISQCDIDCLSCALGVDLQTAIQHAVSSHSYWHMARTLALQQGLSNPWLKSQGLVSIKDLWIKAQGYAI